MNTLLKQYQTELRNIALLALLIALIPYLPAVVGFVQTFTGIMVCIGLLCGFILGMSLKVYYRIAVMRIRREDEAEGH